MSIDDFNQFFLKWIVQVLRKWHWKHWQMDWKNFSELSWNMLISTHYSISKAMRDRWVIFLVLSILCEFPWFRTIWIGYKSNERNNLQTIASHRPHRNHSIWKSWKRRTMPWPTHRCVIYIFIIAKRLWCRIKMQRRNFNLFMTNSRLLSISSKKQGKKEI